MNTTNSTLPLDELISFYIVASTSPVLVILFLILAITTLVLSVIFRKKQPLKSRGLTYVFLILAFLCCVIVASVKGVVEAAFPTITNILDCYASLFLFMPAILLYVSLLLTRNIRYIFVVNINKLKNVIFGTTKVSELLKESEEKKKNHQPSTRRSIFTKRKSVATVDDSSANLTNNNTSPLTAPSIVSSPTTSSPEIESPVLLDLEAATNLESVETMSNADEVAHYFDTKIDTRALKKLGLLKFMTSYYITFAIVGIIVIVWYLFAVLYSIITQGNDPNCSVITYSIAFIVCGVLYLVSFGILILDLLLQGKELAKCKLHYIFCRHDKFLFHIEYFIIFCTNLSIFINQVLAVAVPQYETILFSKYSFIGTTLMFCIAYAHVFAIAGFILFVTIVWECKRKRKSRQAANSGSEQLLENVMKDTKLQFLFREFCEQEWSLENFLCYQDIILWKQKAKQNSKLKIASQIYEKYITQGCALEINIPNHVRDKAKLFMQNASAHVDSTANTEAPDIPSPNTNTVSTRDNFQLLVKEAEELLLQILREVKANLNDTLHRFLVSPNFTQYMDETKLKEDILAT